MASDGGVISIFVDGVGVVFGHTTVDEQGEQQGGKHATPRGTYIDGQCGRKLSHDPHRSASQEIQKRSADTQVIKLADKSGMELEC